MTREAPRDGAVWLFIGVLLALPAMLWFATGGPELPMLSPHISWLVLALIFAVTEAASIHLPAGRETHSFTFSEIPLLLGLLFSSPSELVAANVLGGSAALLLRPRLPLIKLAFNSTSFVLQSVVAGSVYGLLLRSTDPLDPRGWLAAGAAAVAGSLTTAICVQIAMALRSGSEATQQGRMVLLYSLITAVVGVDLGLLAVLLVEWDPWSGILVGFLVTTTYLLYRGFHALRQRHARLGPLYQFTKTVNRSLQTDSVIPTLITECRRLMRANHVALALLAGDGTLQGGSGDGDLLGQEWWHPALTGTVVHHPRTRRGRPAPGLEGTAHGDGLAVPLYGDTSVRGAIVVADRIDDVSTFDVEDIRLLQSMAGHASVTLDNSRLVERVRSEAAEKEYLAQHDTVTGLPNRVLFTQRLEEQLAADGSAAVVLMDLDSFKEVNDTLGHSIGDGLLREVASRLDALAAQPSMVARLGGDEFAVLVPGPNARRSAEGVARGVQVDLVQPFRVGELDLEMSASTGVAVAPQDGTTSAQLLRRAEVAMYRAKDDVSRIVHYSPEHDPYSPRRLSVIADLPRGLANGQFTVLYQPKAETSMGRVVGVEALVRWQHPTWGPVSPEEFVPLAERSGHIRALTRFVLGTTLRQCTRWREQGLGVGVAVNLSVRNLLEDELVHEIAGLLVRSNVPAHYLTLEVTESAIMSDPARSIAMLERLVDLGVTVSVDDFGTGYSSLALLKSLPVQEVKIDRSFVRHIASDTGDAAIVRSVVELGHNLGLRVVAEGVEDPEAWRLLGQLGCDVGQGYHLSRPMAAVDTTPWLRDNLSRFARPLRDVAKPTPTADDVSGTA